MKTGSTHLVILLDRSGSMHAIKEDTIGGLHNLIEEQKKLPGECRLTLAQFDWENGLFRYEEIYKNKLIIEVSEVRLVPRGWTPLLDAVGRAINDTGRLLSETPEDERPEFVIFVIATDGLENRSSEFSCGQIKSMIKTQTETYKWKFAYIGANQDAFAEAGGIGISAQASMTYAPNSAGVKAAYLSVSRGVADVRMRTSEEVCFMEEDYDKQRKAGVKIP